MIVNIRLGLQHDLDAPILRMKIRNQDLDNYRGIHFTDRADGTREMSGAAILQIISRNCSNDNVLQFHSTHRLGDTLRFVFLQGVGFGRCHRTKPTGACAAIPRYHHRGRTLAPAFPAIRTLRAFANRMQAQIGNKRFRRKENRVRRQPHLDPGRFLCLVERRIHFRTGHCAKVSPPLKR